MNRSLRNHITRQAGFTLLEIMMVVAIIGLLAGLAASMVDNLSIARETKVKSDIQTIATQIMVYESLNGFPPTSEQGLKALVQQPSSAPVPRNWRQLMKEIPQDPWGMDYQYVTPGRHNGDSYDLFSAGKDRIPNTDDDIGNWRK
jgi:general secretion pathway protein G